MKCALGGAAATIMMGLMNSRPQNNYHLLSKCGQWLMVSCWTLLAGLRITIIISGLLLDTRLWGVSWTGMDCDVWTRAIMKNVLAVYQLLGEKNRWLSLLCREMNCPVSSVQIESPMRWAKKTTPAACRYPSCCYWWIDRFASRMDNGRLYSSSSVAKQRRMPRNMVNWIWEIDGQLSMAAFVDKSQIAHNDDGLDKAGHSQRDHYYPIVYGHEPSCRPPVVGGGITNWNDCLTDWLTACLLSCPVLFIKIWWW